MRSQDLVFLIVDARNSLSLDLVMAAIIVIGVLGLLLDKAIRYFETWVAKFGAVKESSYN